MYIINFFQACLYGIEVSFVESSVVERKKSFYLLPTAKVTNALMMIKYIAETLP